MTDLSPGQQEVFKAIQNYIASKGYSPSIRDVASSLGLSSTTIVGCLSKLKEKGYVTWDYGVARSIRLTT